MAEVEQSYPWENERSHERIGGVHEASRRLADEMFCAALELVRRGAVPRLSRADRTQSSAESHHPQ